MSGKTEINETLKKIKAKNKLNERALSLFESMKLNLIYLDKLNSVAKKTLFTDNYIDDVIQCFKKRDLSFYENSFHITNKLNVVGNCQVDMVHKSEDILKTLLGLDISSNAVKLEKREYIEDNDTYFIYDCVFNIGEERIIVEFKYFDANLTSGVNLTQLQNYYNCSISNNQKVRYVISFNGNAFYFFGVDINEKLILDDPICILDFEDIKNVTSLRDKLQFCYSFKTNQLDLIPNIPKYKSWFDSHYTLKDSTCENKRTLLNKEDTSRSSVYYEDAISIRMSEITEQKQDIQIQEIICRTSSGFICASECKGLFKVIEHKKQYLESVSLTTILAYALGVFCTDSKFKQSLINYLKEKDSINAGNKVVTNCFYSTNFVLTTSLDDITNITKCRFRRLRKYKNGASSDELRCSSVVELDITGTRFFMITNAGRIESIKVFSGLIIKILKLSGKKNPQNIMGICIDGATAKNKKSRYLLALKD